SARDGGHAAEWNGAEVQVAMRDVPAVERVDERTDWIGTGSPHLVVYVEDPAAVDLLPEAHRHRYGPRFAKEGVNVNFVRWHGGRVQMRTYERGVEAETLSCGTGVTAAALSAMHRGLAGGACTVEAPGGTLLVRAEARGGGFRDVTLQGAVQEVFRGQTEIG